MKPQGETLQHLAAAHAAGILSGRARRRFEAILERDPAARRAWHQWEERLSGLVPPLPPVRPSAQIWQRIESRVTAKPATRKAAPRAWVLIAALIVGSAAVLILARR
jgi:anti-sigma-K factor RskA